MLALALYGLARVTVEGFLGALLLFVAAGWFYLLGRRMSKHFGWR
jgi:hypothetical protein